MINIGLGILVSVCDGQVVLKLACLLVLVSLRVGARMGFAEGIGIVDFGDFVLSGGHLDPQRSIRTWRHQQVYNSWAAVKMSRRPAALDFCVLLRYEKSLGWKVLGRTNYDWYYKK